MTNRTKSTLVLVDAQAVGLGGERRRLDDLGVRVLGGQPREHRVVTGDGVDRALLEQHQAAGVRVGPHRLRRPRRCAASSMLVEPLGAQTFLPARSSMPVIGAAALGRLAQPDQDLLARAVVLAGEGDVLPAVAGDRHVARDDVDAAVLEGWQRAGPR